MKPTNKILLTLSALLSVNALALFEGVARSVNNTATSIAQTPSAMVSKPRPQTQQAPLVPQQGSNAPAPRPYSSAPMPNRPGFNRRPPVLKDPRVTQQAYGKKPFYGNFSNQPVNNPQVNQRFVGSSTFEKSHLPQETHPMNVDHVSDDLF